MIGCRGIIREGNVPKIADILEAFWSRVIRPHDQESHSRKEGIAIRNQSVNELLLALSRDFKEAVVPILICGYINDLETIQNKLSIILLL